MGETLPGIGAVVGAFVLLKLVAWWVFGTPFPYLRHHAHPTETLITDNEMGEPIDQDWDDDPQPTESEERDG